MHKPKSVARLITSFTKAQAWALFKKSTPIIKTTFFDLRQSPKNDPIGRFLIIVPKKVGNAPERNLIRRRLKDIFYKNELYKLNFDWIIFAKPNILKLSFGKLSFLILSHIKNETTK